MPPGPEGFGGGQKVRGGINQEPRHRKEDWRGTPYIGDFKGITWNSNAYMASDIKLYNYRRAHVLKWLRSHDFIILQETHAGLGKEAGMVWDMGGGVHVYNSPHPERSSALSTAGIMLIAND